MEERLKILMQELGNAINDSLSESDQISSAISEIKRAGYDVFLVLEATIGFNKREAEDEDDGPDHAEQEGEREQVSHIDFEPTGKIRWTSQDHKFLSALKISVEDEQS